MLWEEPRAPRRGSGRPAGTRPSAWTPRLGALLIAPSKSKPPDRLTQEPTLPFFPRFTEEGWGMAGRPSRTRKAPEGFDPAAEANKPQFAKAPESASLARVSSVAPGLRRPPFVGGLARHALIALRHDDPNWLHPYYLGVVLKAVPRWDADEGRETRVEIVWCDSPKETKDGWEYKVTAQRDHVQARMVLCQLRELSGDSPQSAATPKKTACSRSEHQYVLDIQREVDEHAQEQTVLDEVDNLVRQYSGRSAAADVNGRSPPSARPKRQRPMPLDIQPPGGEMQVMAAGGRTPRLLPRPPEAWTERFTQEEREFCSLVLKGDAAGVKSRLAGLAQKGRAAFANLVTGGAHILVVAAGCQDRAGTALPDKVSAEICAALLDAGAGPAAIDRSSGRHTLHVAAARGHTATMEVLWRHGTTGRDPTIDIDCRCARGETALHSACRTAQPAAVRLLLRWGADPMLADYIHRRLPCDVIGMLANYEAPSPTGAAAAHSDVRRASAATKVRAHLMQHTPSLRTAIFSHMDCMEHRTPLNHQESPMRVPAILDRLHAAFDGAAPKSAINGSTSKPAAAAAAKHKPTKTDDVAMSSGGCRACAGAHRAHTCGKAQKQASNNGKPHPEVHQNSVSDDDPSRAGHEESLGAGRGCLVYHEDFAPATEDSVRAVHRPEYVEFLTNLNRAIETAASGHGGSAAGGRAAISSPKVPLTPAVQRGLMQFKSPDVKTPENSDTMFTKGSLKAAYRAAGAVMAAVDAVMDGRHRRAFCAVRPPGHHAGSLGLLSDAVSCGFCVFNNVCVGAMHALARDPGLRIAIVDFDVHHGNGTEEIVSRCLRAFQAQEQEPRQPPLWFGSIHLYHSSRKTPTLSVPPERPWRRPLAPNVEPDAGQWLLEPCSPAVGGHGDDFATGSSERHGSGGGGQGDTASSETAPADGSRPGRLELLVPDPGSDEDDELQLEFYPGTGARDDLMLNIINAPLPPLWGVRQTGGAGGPAGKKRKSSAGAAAREQSPRADASGLPPASSAGRVAFRHAVVTRLLPALRAYSPGLLLLSAGFDGAHLDQGNLRDMKPGLDLMPEDFLWLTEQLVAVANLTANGRVVSVLEGGYGKPMAAGGFDRSVLATNCQAHVAGLAGVPFEPI